MQAVGRQPKPASRAPNCAPVHCERHRPGQTTLYRLAQEHAATFFEQAESAGGAGLSQFVKDEFDAFLECGILAHGFERMLEFNMPQAREMALDLDKRTPVGVSARAPARRRSSAEAGKLKGSH